MKEAGLATWNDPGADKPLQAVKTAQCCHCGGHFPFEPKLTTKFYTAEEAKKLPNKTFRGWCMSCNGPVCGPGCAECVPEEQLLENYEKGRPLDFRPIVVSVPAAVTKTGIILEP